MPSRRKSHRRNDRADKPGELSAAGSRTPRPVEQYLMQAASEIEGDQILVASNAGGQAASAIATCHREAMVTCSFLDVFLADAARGRHAGVDNLKVTCLADFPEGEFDAIAIPFPARGENELARDHLQQALQRLSPTGRLFASTDNVKDHWLHQQLKASFGKVTNRELPRGRLYIGSRPKPLRKVKDYGCWFAFRDGERLIEAYSRPGVFSHRRVDAGARALIDSLTIPDGPYAGEAVQEGTRVLDIGCGTGTVGFSAALRAQGVSVHAIDANARAIHCTEQGAAKNEITSLTCQLNADGQCEDPGTFDLVLANPPYFSNFRIAEIFVHAAVRGLKPGGRTHFVTKQPEWFADRFVEVFEDVSVREVKGYFVVKATQPDDLELIESTEIRD